MLKQQYKTSDFLSVIKKTDIRKWKLWESKKDSKKVALRLSQFLEEKKYEVSDLKVSSHRGKRTYMPSRSEDLLALRILDKNLRRIYKVAQSDRGKIIRQIRALMEDAGDFVLIRSDIESFYESIDFSNLFAKIKKDMILSIDGLSLVNSLNEAYKKSSGSDLGIPRGVNVSSTLSELYIRKFDQQLISHESVIYYARFVDDIFVFADRGCQDEVEQLMHKAAESVNLTLSAKKTKMKISSESLSFAYLGYEFTIEVSKSSSGKITRKLDLRIAPVKVKKIKERIHKAFFLHSRDGNERLLLNRLRYLACAKPIKKSEHGTLMAGPEYNYRYILKPDHMKVFDGYIHKFIIPKFNVSEQLVSKLKKISFYRAFKEKRCATFTRRQIAKIKKAWEYE